MKKYAFYSLMLSLFLMAGACKQSNTDNTEISKSAVSATPVSNKITNTTKTDHTTGDLKWLSMSDVESAVSNSKKKILVDVYTDWCGPCKMMDARTFTDASVQQVINEKFYPVKFNAEGPDAIQFQGQSWENPNHDPNKRGRNSQHQLAAFFKVPGYPTLVVLDENMNILKKIVGFKTPDKLLAELNAI